MAYMERRDYCRISKIYENARVQDSIMRKRIANVKSNLDNHAPADSHLRRNTKKEIMMEERYADIEKQNLLLLQRMHTILHSPGSFAGRQSTGPRSMNIKNRREELMRISRDNHMILERIQAVQPMFDAESLRQDAKKQVKYVKRLSLYASGRKGDPSKFVPIQPMRPQSAAPLMTTTTTTSNRPSSSSSSHHNNPITSPGSPGAYHSYRGNKGNNNNQTVNGRMRPTSAPAYSHYNNSSLAMTAPASLLMHPSTLSTTNNNSALVAPLLFPNGKISSTGSNLYPPNNGFIMPSFIQPVSMGSIGSIPSLHSIPPSNNNNMINVPMYQQPLMMGGTPTQGLLSNSIHTSRSVSTNGSINNGINNNNNRPSSSSSPPLTINTTDVSKGTSSNMSTATSASSKSMTTGTNNGNDTARSTVSTVDNNNNTSNTGNSVSNVDDSNGDNNNALSSRPRSASNQNNIQPGSRPASARMMRPESAKGRRPGSGRPDSAGASRTTNLLVGPTTVGTILESTEDNTHNHNNNASNPTIPSVAVSTNTTDSASTTTTNNNTDSSAVQQQRPNSAGNRPLRPESARPGSARNNNNNASSSSSSSSSSAAIATVDNGSSTSIVTPPSPTSVNRPWSSSRRVQFQPSSPSNNTSTDNNDGNGNTLASPSIAITESLLLSPVNNNNNNNNKQNISAVDISIETDEGSTSLNSSTVGGSSTHHSTKHSAVPSTAKPNNVVVGEDDLADDSFIKEDPAGDDADSIGPDHHDPLYRGGPDDSL